MIVVSDTSALTALIQVGRQALLQDLYEIVLIPEAVRRELARSHPILPGFLEVRTVADEVKVKRLKANLDLGEAEAIVLAFGKPTPTFFLLTKNSDGLQLGAKVLPSPV